MKLPHLVQRRELWFPTLWGWGALLFIGVAIVLLLGRNLYSFLAVNDPVRAQVLIVEGWMGPDELDQAIAAYRAGHYERIVTTGGPLYSWPRTHATYADRAADYLRQEGIPPSSVIAVHAPKSAQERTYLSAVMVREWARQTGLNLPAVDVFSVGTHARRSRLLYRLAFGSDLRVGVLAGTPSDYDPAAWWRTSVGARDVLDQAIGLLWVKLFFWPVNKNPAEAGSL